MTIPHPTDSAGRFTNAYSTTRAEYDATPRWRIRRRRKLRSEMRLYGSCLVASFAPRPPRW